MARCPCLVENDKYMSPTRKGNDDEAQNNIGISRFDCEESL